MLPNLKKKFKAFCINKQYSYRSGIAVESQQSLLMMLKSTPQKVLTMSERLRRQSKRLFYKDLALTKLIVFRYGRYLQLIHLDRYAQQANNAFTFYFKQFSLLFLKYKNSYMPKHLFINKRLRAFTVLGTASARYISLLVRNNYFWNGLLNEFLVYQRSN